MPSAMVPTPTVTKKKKKGFGHTRRRPRHAHTSKNSGGRAGSTTTTLQEEAIIGDADLSANVSANAAATDVPVVVQKQNREFDSTSKAVNTDELSGLLTSTIPQESSSSSPMKPSALFPTNSTFYKTRRSTAAATSPKFLQHTSLGGVTLVLHFSEQEHKVICFAITKILEQDDITSE